MKTPYRPPTDGGADPPPLKVLGIRHHGPGSALAVKAALERLDPAVVLIEGPPEADAVVGLAGHREMKPPVALLSHVVNDPAQAAFWPFATFSPEWQAIRWALRRKVPVRFIDLPASNMFALDAERRDALPERGTADGEAGDEVEPVDDVQSEDIQTDEAAPASEPSAKGTATPERTDPIAQLAAAAGQDDPERWWEDVMEQRFSDARWGEHGDGFDAIVEAMAAVRNHSGSHHRGVDEQIEQRREAHMRKSIRAAQAEFASVAVVCGAWHGPALLGMLDGPRPTKASDARVLKAMPKQKVATTWVPWTNSRLAHASGYGAGVTAPGWYQHLFEHRENTVVHWMTSVARVLRDRDLPVSSADVIETVRLAETLATLRDRPLAGLAEVTDATRSVMCGGDEHLLTYVTRDAVVSERLGTVPAEAVRVPLEADLRATAKRLRLRFSAEPKLVRLDLRKENDRAKSRLLQRLAILGIGWGAPEHTSSTGTFAESWTLIWEPELSVQLVEASVHGTTVEAAAAARLVSSVDSLAGATTAVESALRAELSSALPELLRLVDSRAATDLEVTHAMEAFPALVRARRYGTVRRTDTGQLLAVTAVLLERICAGLPASVGGLADEAAAELVELIDQVHAAVSLAGADDREPRRIWLTTLQKVSERGDLNGLLAGRITRLLAEAEVIDGEQAALRFGRALSHGSTAGHKASWVQGFLSGSPLLLIHDDALVKVLDNWVCGLSEEDFIDVVPVLRRTFGAYQQTDRNLILANATRAGAGEDRPGQQPDFELAAGVLQTVGRLISLARQDDPAPTAPAAPEAHDLEQPEGGTR